MTDDDLKLSGTADFGCSLYPDIGRYSSVNLLEASERQHAPETHKAFILQVILRVPVCISGD
jgi:hypothetical protein